MKTLLLHKNIADQIARHAEDAYPNECCGFMFGSDAEVRQVTHAYPVKNAKEGDRRRRFRIAGDDYHEAEKFALENNLDLLGVYHSHPDHPAEASEHDRAVAMPYFSYIIISVQKGRASDTRSWQLNEQREFEEEAVEIVTPNEGKTDKTQ